MNTNEQPACIWVDADAAPKAIREILCKAAVRTQVHIWFVANHALPLPKSEWIHSRIVAAGFDVADNSIVQSARPGDLLITQDIPLAAEILASVQPPLRIAYWGAVQRHALQVCRPG